MSPDFFATALIWYVAFLFSTVCHEAAHALVAKWGGDLTAYSGGQVTLDPIPHIKREPFGLVVIPLLCLVSSGGSSLLGWGTAPVDPFWQIRYPRRAAIMALAGPLSNFIIAIIAALIMYLGISQGIFELNLAPLITSKEGVFLEGAALFLNVLFILNIILGVFNLLPFPPFDGYSVLGLFIPEELAVNMFNFARTSGFSMMGLVVAYLVFPKIAGPIVSGAIYLFLLPLMR